MLRVFIVILFSLFVTVRAESLTAKFSVEDYAPFVSKKVKDNGMLSKIIKEAFALEGVKTKLSFYPGARAYSTAKLGKSDGSFPWADRKHRHVDFYYGEPLIKTDSEYFFVRKDFSVSWDPKKLNFSTLKGLRFAASLGSNYGKEFEAAEKGGVIDVTRVGTLAQAFKMLLVNRVDLIISPEKVAKYHVAKNLSEVDRKKVKNIKAISRTVHNDYLIFSKHSQNGKILHEKFNTGLKKLKKSGRYKEIIDEFSF